MSIRYSGDASRSFIMGNKLWAPAITRGLGPWLPRDTIATSKLVARSYSNGPGVCTRSPFGRGLSVPRHPAANARLRARLVLRRRVGADHGRARHPLRARLTDLWIQLARRETARRGVAQRRPGGAGGC